MVEARRIELRSVMVVSCKNTDQFAKNNQLSGNPELYAWIKSQENANQYLKELVRKDMRTRS